MSHYVLIRPGVASRIEQCGPFLTIQRPWGARRDICQKCLASTPSQSARREFRKPDVAWSRTGPAMRSRWPVGPTGVFR